MKNNRLIFIELNELNFDLVSRYIDSYPGKLPGFEKILKLDNIKTTSEDKYCNLEPWIQWVSIHTGLKFEEHNVYRLGDIVLSEAKQLYEVLEQAGLKVGCISPMNSKNLLSDAAFFIPDPWTNTESDRSWWSRQIHAALVQAVNDNAKNKITFRTFILLVLAWLRFSKPNHWYLYIKLAFGSIRRPWRRALFLDLFLHDLHIALLRKSNPDFSSVFLNAGAHIQHHYYFNSPYSGSKNKNPVNYIDPADDPIYEMLRLYDVILKEMLKNERYELLIATALSQKPYDRVKYYYRLKNHANFLNKLGIRHKKVMPLMTRDFVIEFNSSSDADEAVEKLNSLHILDSTQRVFGDIERRENSVFVSLTYPNEISSKTLLVDKVSNRINFGEYVSFVALKNGMHQGKGFVYASKGFSKYMPSEDSHVCKLNHSILTFYKIN